MGKRCSWGLLVLGLLLFASSPVAAQGRHAEGKILWDLRHSFTDPGGSRLQGWESAQADFCSGWTGVTCDSDGYVVSLDLTEQGLQGMLPASLGQLSRLQSLKLCGSELAQALPDQWAAADSFPALAALDLTHAAQKWELPQSWSREGAFPALRELRLGGITLAGVSAAVKETGRVGDRRLMGWRRRLAQSGVVTASDANDFLPASQRTAFSSVAPAPAPESVPLLAGTTPEASPAAIVPSTSTPFSTTAAPTTTVAPSTATAQAPVTVAVPNTTGAPATTSPPSPTPSAPPATAAAPSPVATTAPPTTSQSLTSTPAPTSTAPASSTPIPSSVAPSTAAPSTTSQPPSSTSTPAPPVTSPPATSASAVPPSPEPSTPAAAAPTAATGSTSTPASTPAATTAAPSRTNSTSPSPNLIITSSPTVSPTAQPTTTATLRALPPVTSAPTPSPEQSPTPNPTSTPAHTTTGVAAVAPALGSTAGSVTPVPSVSPPPSPPPSPASATVVTPLAGVAYPPATSTPASSPPVAAPPVSGAAPATSVPQPSTVPPTSSPPAQTQQPAPSPQTATPQPSMVPSTSTAMPQLQQPAPTATPQLSTAPPTLSPPPQTQQPAPAPQTSAPTTPPPASTVALAVTAAPVPEVVLPTGLPAPIARTLAASPAASEPLAGTGTAAGPALAEPTTSAPSTSAPTTNAAVPTTLTPQPPAPAPQAVAAATPAPTTSTAAPTTTSAPPKTTAAPATSPPSTSLVPSTPAATGAPPVAAPAAVESSVNVSAGVPTTSVPAPPPSPLILPAGRTAQAPSSTNISGLAGQGSAQAPATVSSTGTAPPAAASLGTNSSRSAAPSPGAALQAQNTSQNASAPAPVPSSATVSSQRPLAPAPSVLESTQAQPPTILPVMGTATAPISGPSGLPHPAYGQAVAPSTASPAAGPTILPIPSLGRAPGPSVALGPTRLAAGAGAPIPAAAGLAGLARVPANAPAPAPRTPALPQDGPAPAPTVSGSSRVPAQQPAGLEALAPAPGLQALAPAPAPSNGSSNASSAPVPAPGTAVSALGSTAMAPSPIAGEAAGLGGQGPAPQPSSSSGSQEAASPAPGAAAAGAGVVGNSTTPEAASPSNPELPTNQSASGPALAPTGVISIASLPGSDVNATNVTATKQYLAPSDIPANVSDSTLSTAIVSTDITSTQTFNNLDDLETPLLNVLNDVITQAGYTAYLAIPNVTYPNGTQSFNLSELAPGAAPAPLPQGVNISVSVVNDTSAAAPPSTHNATDANGILVDTSSRRRSLLQGRNLLQSSNGTHLQINITITAQNDSTAAISQLVQQALASGQVQSQLQASGLSANFSNVLVTVIAPGVPTNTLPASQIVGNQPKSSGAGANIGAIVGAAVGAFVLAVLAILVGWRVKRHRHNRKVWKRDLETARAKPAGSLEGSSDSNSSGGPAGKKPLAMTYVPFGVGSNDSVDATPHAKHATGLDAFAGQRRQRAELKAGRSGRSTGHPLTDSAGGNNNMGTNMSGLMGTGFSDVMTTEGSGNTPKHSSGAASDRPYGYGHPKYDPHLAQRNPLTRGISNEHLLKGQSDELSDATVLGGASSGGLPGNALVPSRQASGAVDANKWAVNWGDLEVQKQIGEGSFGRVYLAKWRETTVAVKVLSSTGASSSMEEEQEAIIDNAHLLEGLAKEAGMMASMRHPNVVMYLGLCMDPPCVVTEYCARGSLNDVLKRARQMPALASQLDWARRLNMVLDAAKGMMYLHSSEPPVIHRDLKSPNLLVDKHWRVKVCDFNLSRVMEETVVLSSMAASNPRWLAPEILGGKGYSFSSDVYSFGMIMWEFLTWQVPWHDCGPWQVVALVTEGQQRPELPSKEDMPGDSRSFAGLDEYIQLMHRCWHQVPESRPTFAETITVLRRLLAAEMRTRSGQMTKQVSVGSDEVKPALE